MRRMKAVVAGVALFAFFVILVSPAYAEGDIVGKMGNKLKRGIVNVVTGWVEIFNQPRKVAETEGWGSGMTKGVALGVGWTVARTVVGAWDTVTFLFPIPSDYGPVLDPEYVF